MSSSVISRVIAAGVLMAIAATGLLRDGSARASEELFGRFFATATSHCRKAAAPACVDRLWPIADRNRDGVLRFEEVETLYRSAEKWAARGDAAPRGLERNVALVSLMVLKYAGLKNVFGNFDADGDGTLTRGEVFGDFRMDGRPFGKLVADAGAVDWRSFMGKLGKAGALIRDLLPPSHRKE